MNHRLLALVALTGIVLSGCVQKTEEPSTTPGGATTAPTASGGGKSADEKLRIAVVPKGTTYQFWQTIKQGAEAAGQEVNAEILWNGPESETDKQDQIDIINNFASQGVDGIAMAATDKNALIATVEALDQKGIPVVTVDSGVDSEVPKSFIATDNAEAAKLAAREMGRLLNGKGKVAVLSFPKGAATSDEREQGFMDGIKEFPGIQVVATEYTDSDSAKAQDKMESLLTAHPDLNGVFASNEPNVVGAAKVISDRKLAGKIKLLGFDASDPEIQYIKDGVVQGAVVQDPFKMGYEGVKAIAMLVRGQGTPDKRIDTGAKLVTKENLETPEIQKLLYPLGKK